VGVFLDTSVGIKTQRLGLTHIQMLRLIRTTVGETDLATSTIVLTEMLHGVYRTKVPAIRQRRHDFIEAFLREVAVFPYDTAIAELAGRVGGEQAALGQTIPPVDMMIGATALSLGFSILTVNVRHFRMIPGLDVIPF